MKATLFSLLLVFLLVGCSSPMKRQFVAGCSQGGMVADKDMCECLYDKTEEYYGEDELKRMAVKNEIPPDFIEKAFSFAEQCI